MNVLELFELGIRRYYENDAVSCSSREDNEILYSGWEYARKQEKRIQALAAFIFCKAGLDADETWAGLDFEDTVKEIRRVLLQ